MNSLRLSTLMIALLAAAAAGCGEQEQITRYQVDKPHVVFEANHTASAQPPAQQTPMPTGPPTHRMLAAYLPYQEQGWFFKLVGPIEAVADEVQPFRAFLQSIEFDDSGKPSWKLPDGWETVPGTSSMRFATILIDAEPRPIELTVIPLPMPGGPSADYELSNINRWRQQMMLAPLTPQELDEQTESFETSGVEGTIVDIEGHFQSGGMTAPFASGGRAPFAAGAPAGAAPRTARAGEPPFEFAAPEAWSELPASGMRKAAFNIAAGEQQAEVTVIDLAAAAGDLLPNVNRWRGQIGLAPMSAAELEAAVQKIKAGELTADFVELTGAADAAPRQSILAAILVHDGKAWFFKLMGDADLAAREKSNFQKFVESVRFDGK